MGAACTRWDDAFYFLGGVVWGGVSSGRVAPSKGAGRQEDKSGEAGKKKESVSECAFSWTSIGIHTFPSLRAWLAG